MKKELKETIEFARNTYRTMFIHRYGNIPRIFTENVASHCYQVSVLSLFLTEKLNNIFNFNNNSKLKILRMALIHDLGEIVDIPHDIKHNHYSIKCLLNDIEIVELERLLDKKYSNLLKEYNNGKTIESLIVELSDVIACKIYAEEEIKLGNIYFSNVKSNSEKRIKILIKRIENIIERGK